MSSIEAGEILRGKYRIERVLGAGGMGVVLLATHLRLGQRVAVKILRRNAEETDVAKRFAREARIASRLRGEHAVRILDVDDSEVGEPFLVMEYLEGGDLEQRLAGQGSESGLPVADAVGYVLQACEGMAEAHALGIVHRDLKPANLFVTRRPDGTELVKVLDFGISKALEPEPQDFAITRQEAAIGSPSYMSPEQLRDAGSVDVRTDVWALGVVLFQLLAHKMPFEATTTAALAARIAADPAPSLRALREEVPEALEAVVLRCLEKEPAKRFGGVAELARALAPFAPGGEASAERTGRVAELKARPADAPAADPGAITGPATGPATQSLSDVAGALGPLAPLGGETGAPMTSSSAEVAAVPKRRSWPIALAVVAVAGALGATALFVRRPAPATPANAAVPATTSASLASSSPPLPPPGLASAPPASSPPSATVRLPAPRRPTERVVSPPPARSAPGRNPMDLDFR